MRKGLAAIGFIAAVVLAAALFRWWSESQKATAPIKSTALLPASVTSPVELPAPSADPASPAPIAQPAKTTAAVSTRPLMPCSEWQLLVLKAQQNDPKWREATLALTRIDREESLPTVALDLDLSDEQASALYDLLAERDTRSARGMKTAATQEEAREYQRLRDQDIQNSDAAIRELLGSRKFTQFQEYQAGGRARSQIDRLQTALANSTDALQPDQIKALTRALSKNQQTVVVTADAPNPIAPTAVQSPHDVAAKVLSPEQLARFDELRRAESQRTEAVNRMYSAMRDSAQRDKAELVAAVAAPPPATPTSTTASPSRPCERAPRPAGWLEQQQRLRENPEYLAARRDIRRLEMTVSRLDAMSVLHWSEDEINRLVELVADQRVRQEDALNFQYATPEERQANRRKRSELDRQFDEERKALLGDEKFREWKAYRESIAARNEAYELRAQLALTPQPLREDQLEPLITTLNKEFQAVKAEIDNDPSNPFAPNAAVTSPEDSAKYLERLETANEHIHDAAAFILSNEQLKRLDRIRTLDLARDRATIDLNRAQRDITQHLQSSSTNGTL